MTPCSVCGDACYGASAHACCVAWGRADCPACKASKTNLRKWVSEAAGRIRDQADTITWLDGIGLLTPESRDERLRHLEQMRAHLADAEASLAARGAA